MVQHLETRGGDLCEWCSETAMKGTVVVVDMLKTGETRGVTQGRITGLIFERNADSVQRG